jgi:response regulator NasT
LIYITSEQSKEGAFRPPTNAQPTAADASVSLTHRRILIVEDEGITQMQLRKILSRAGMIVVGAAFNGPQGVKLALEQRPEIILMDINMPGDFNGLEAARRILSVYSTCVVMLTAYSDYAEEAEAIGASGYVVKPLDAQSLLPQIRAAFQRFRKIGS